MGCRSGGTTCSLWSGDRSRSRRRARRCLASAHSNTAGFEIGFAPKLGTGATPMRKIALVLCLFVTTGAFAQTNNPKDPTWWHRFEYLFHNGALAGGGATSSVTVGGNIDVSNECGPQRHPDITLHTANPKNLAGGLNVIIHIPTRGH